MTKRWVFWFSTLFFLLLFLFLIRSILLPFVLGIFTAYFLDPAADKLQSWRLSRTAATSIITICFFAAALLLCIIIVPVLISQLSGLFAAMPDYFTHFEERYAPLLAQWWGALSPEEMEGLKNEVSNLSTVMIGVVSSIASGVLQSGMAIVNILSLVLITPVVAFYLLHDWDTIIERMDQLLPRPYAETIREQLAIIDRTIAGFIRGQLNVCLLLGLYYAIGLSLVGLKFGIMIGLATGLLAIIPYAGLLFGIAMGLGIAFFQFDTLTPVLLVLAVFITGQIIEGNFVTPKLVGEKVGLHPVWIIFGMLAGAALFGFVGVLLAVPVTAVIGVLIRFGLERYLASGYYRGNNNIPSPPRGEG